MITDAEILREARAAGVQPLVVDLDHALGVVLWALVDAGLSEWEWVLKGGTALRKLHIPGYRFSEDLDFTLLSSVDTADVAAKIRRVAGPASDHSVELLENELRVEVLDDESDHESVEVSVPYRGTHAYRGSPQRVRFHLSADEVLVFPIANKDLIHPYSDAEALCCRVPVYALEEVLAEKLRAVCGQRRYSIARDVYDIARLVELPLDLEAALGAVPTKAEFKGVEIKDAAQRLAARRDDLAANWDATLDYLVTGSDARSFDVSFEVCLNMLERLS
jgi:predicted nucleotidyltransferase component of viral defense system